MQSKGDRDPFKAAPRAEVRIQHALRHCELAGRYRPPVLCVMHPRARRSGFAHLKCHHGLERLRLRGPSGARDESQLAAIAQNLKTLVNRRPSSERWVG